MPEISSLVLMLKRVLKANGITYAQIADTLGISEPSIKRNFSEESFTLERFSRICEIAGISIAELSALIRTEDDSNSYTYTLEQENFFAENPRYLAFFDLLIRLGSLPKIRKQKPALKEHQINLYFRQLEKMGLAERLTGDQFRLLVSRNVTWNKNGPLRNKFLPMARNDFLDGGFNEENRLFRFSSLQLTDHSYRTFIAEIDKLHKNITHAADIEKSIKATTTDIGVMFALRPWKFGLLEDC